MERVRRRVKKVEEVAARGQRTWEDNGWGTFLYENTSQWQHRDSG